MIYTVVCTDINDYVNWQCELLEYSWSRINQPGKLVRLVACEENQGLPEHRHAEVIRTRPSNVHPNSGDVYVCYNRLYSLQQWLETYDVQGSILIVDSDVVFRAPIKTEVVNGKPVGQSWLDYNVSDAFRGAIEAASRTVDIDALQAVTWPALIDADDLRALLPRWIEATVSIREQIRRQESDMFGFLIAAQENSLSFQLETTTAFMPWPDEQVSGAPLIHYCQEVKSQNGRKLWSKFDYQPWQRVNGAQLCELPYCVDLLKQVDEFARIKNATPNHQSDTIFIAIASYCEPELIDTINSCLSKARHPQNLRFGICHQFDNREILTSEQCLDGFSQDTRFRYVTYDYQESQGGCWARNIAQQLYQDEVYTLQIDAHTQMVESWDTILIEMLKSLPSTKPLISQFPPLYSIEETGLEFHKLDDFSQVNVAVAQEWSDEGWLQHSQEYIDKHNHFPRRTRLISGAFAFTTGEWNQVVQQDPSHFYTGEEFALAVRSYTHGYDLFDPSQIVAWHRLHPHTNRKFWDDNSKKRTQSKHLKAIERLNLLLDGDPDNKLGRFGLGEERSLKEYADFSGIDCNNKTLSDDARLGVPPLLEHEKPVIHIEESYDEALIEVTVHLDGRQPLLLTCYESTQVLMNLFQGLRRKATFPEDVFFLNLGEDGSEKVYFKQKQILSIETTPVLSDVFFKQYVDLLSAESEPVNQQQALSVQQPQVAPELTIKGGEISDDWKIWIWKNIERGCPKSDIYKQLIDNGFPEYVARVELNYQETATFEPPINSSDNVNAPQRYIANPAASRINNEKLEIYSVDGFLNAVECQELYSLVENNLQRSTVIDKTNADASASRTSHSCFFDLTDSKNRLAAQVSERISKFIGINSSYVEPIQAQFYQPGEEYKPHLDWIEPGTPSYESQTNVAAGGQRTWSVLVYLNDVEVGGETNFSQANLVVEPELGKMVFWNNAKPDGEMNRDTLHQACPVVSGQKAVLTLWFRSFGQGPMYQREPSDLIPRYTADGIRKQLMPQSLFKALSEFYASATNASRREEFVEGGFLQSDTNMPPSTMVDLPETLTHLIHCDLLAICEEWSRTPLQLTSIYGIREYARGTSLKLHSDRCETHIISVILNIAQTVDRDWPLIADDHMCRRHAITLQPGEMLMYEGARLIHGRPDAFEGDNYANIFVHFCPA